MIAGEEDQPGALRLVGLQPLDDLCRRRAAIDEVAKEDDDALRRGSPGRILLDPGEQLAKQIVPAMDVADRIEHVPGRQLRPTSGRRCAEQPCQEGH